MIDWFYPVMSIIDPVPYYVKYTPVLFCFSCFFFVCKIIKFIDVYKYHFFITTMKYLKNITYKRN